MTNLQLKGSWNEVKRQAQAEVRPNWLTTALDLPKKTKKDFLVDSQKKLGKSKEDLRTELESW